ncbi:hypothetical protein [Chryseobacterium indoltheticum]|uniref:hypothetical protein n=1 Tax=Chryseobacterium indoltheticum TaxID=254 RepID=UPI0040417F9B
MEKIREFLIELFEKEQKAIFLEYSKDKIEEYNIFIEEKINIYFKNPYDKDLDKIIPFNLIGKLHNPASDRFYKSKENAPYPTPRHLYKITHYQNGTYGDLWACFVSVDNPGIGQTKILHSCFIVTLIDDDLKIVAQFNPDRDTGKWAFVGGDRELKMYKLGKLLSIERYLEPVNDDWGIEQYNKDI